MDPTVIAEVLTRKAGAPTTYRIRTVYCVRNDRRIRLRAYDNTAPLWVECKRRKDGVVLKRRAKSRLLKGQVPTGWKEVTHVTYRRKAWDLTDDVRVTIDRSVRSGNIWLGCSVVEVKGPKVPRWLRALLPRRERTFSKRRWATERVEGR